MTATSSLLLRADITEYIRADNPTIISHCVCTNLTGAVKASLGFNPQFQSPTGLATGFDHVDTEIESVYP